MSSIGGISAFQNLGIYHASKWALGGVLPGAGPGGRTIRHPRHVDRAGRLLHGLVRPSAKHATPLPAYAEAHEAADRARSQRTAKSGDPRHRRPLCFKIVDAEQPPLRVFFGELPLQLAKADYENRLKTWEEWQPVAVAAQG